MESCVHEYDGNIPEILPTNVSYVTTQSQRQTQRLTSETEIFVVGIPAAQAVRSSQAVAHQSCLTSFEISMFF